VENLFADSGGGRPSRMLEAAGEAVSEEEGLSLIDRAVAETSGFHTAHPLRPGMPKPSLAEVLGISLFLLEALVARTDLLADDGPTVRSTSFTGDLDPAADAAWREARKVLVEAGWAVPRKTELGLDPELVHSLVRKGELVPVGDDFVYPPDRLDGLLELVGGLPDGFSVAEFRDELEITRKHAIPLLEWLDGNGVTRREGEGRVVRRRRPGGPAPDAARSP
jgi:selenocysteine-specific elongation factor